LNKLLALAVALVTLATVSGTYGFTFVSPPSEAFHGFPGFTYAVEYECGVLTPSQLLPSNRLYFALGIYGTDILVHNPQAVATYFYIKILDSYNDLSLWATNPNSPGGTVMYRFPVPADGLLSIDCTEIFAAETAIAKTSVDFANGLIIISQPVVASPLGVVPSAPSVSLDVVAAYTLQGAISGTAYGVGKDVVVYTGRGVSNVPYPCVLSDEACQATLPP